MKELMKIEEFNSLRLVGGTALALQIGHRISVDLDFFGKFEFSKIDDKIFQKYDRIEYFRKSKNINVIEINDIKVDFVNYTYPWLKEPYVEEGIRMAQPEDIAAMKIAAITNRGTRKDFVDLYFLLKMFSFEKIMQLYNEKYFDASSFLALKSLTYFADAENDNSVNMIDNINWEEVKEVISEEVRKYTN